MIRIAALGCGRMGAMRASLGFKEGRLVAVKEFS
jgi:hypothetical protein